jgi:hypothetical protein
MIVLAHTARWSGLIGTMQAVPIVSGGAFLLLLTGVQAIVRLRPGTAPTPSIAKPEKALRSPDLQTMPAERAPSARRIGPDARAAVSSAEQADEHVAPADPIQSVDHQRADADLDEEQSAGGGSATATACHELRLQFSLGDQDLVLSMSVGGSDPDLIAAKAVKAARELMRRRGKVETEAIRLVVTSAELAPIEPDTLLLDPELADNNHSFSVSRTAWGGC